LLKKNEYHLSLMVTADNCQQGSALLKCQLHILHPTPHPFSSGDLESEVVLMSSLRNKHRCLDSLIGTLPWGAESQGEGERRNTNGAYYSSSFQRKTGG